MEGQHWGSHRAPGAVSAFRGHATTGEVALERQGQRSGQQEAAEECAGTGHGVIVQRHGVLRAQFGPL